MPRSYGRNERVAAAILREIADVLHNELKDPRVESCMNEMLEEFVW